MDKEGEQPPAGGIDLRGRLTVMRSLPFVQQEQRAARREPFKPSQSTHCTASLGLQPHNSLKGHPFSTPGRGVGDVTAIVE